MCNATILIRAICLCFFAIQTIHGFHFINSTSDVTRTRRQARQRSCRSNEFQCKSGECIDTDKECDGSVDCKDVSDESSACKRLRCAQYAFRCSYGACVNPNVECDGKPDCRDASDESSPKCKVHDTSPNCTNSQFTCTSGQCIPLDNKCDGRAECKDNSDEISATCWNMRCPGFAYRCKYGACVNGNAECNGIVDCFDGSDEDPAICKNVVVTPSPPTPTPTPGTIPDIIEGGCTLPNQPQNGNWSVYINGRIYPEYKPGQMVASGAILRIQCKAQHKLDGENGIFCETGTWSSGIGTCLTLCPSIYSSATVKVTCNFNTNNETENCIAPVDGTLVKYECAAYYEDQNLSKQQVDICRDGSWSLGKPRCTPVCGQKSVSAQTLIVNGKTVTRGEYPWQVALYDYSSKLLLCGGSLLNQRVILTAAHCVTETETGELISKENYIVAVGKYYRQFNDTRDANEAQFSALHDIIVSDKYQGDRQNYVGDIAILVTMKTFILSGRVQPVCVDWGNNYDSVQNQFGYVTGWGYTIENDKPSEVLKELKVPAVSKDVCGKATPEDFQRFLTFDKLCAGYLDNGTAVCSGDSGGGLVFKFSGRYYITGIVSLSPTSKHKSTPGCDSQQYGFYTQVSRYIKELIIPKESLYRP